MKTIENMCLFVLTESATGTQLILTIAYGSIRKWLGGWSRLQTKLTVSDDGFKLPSMAMKTAIMPNGSDIMYFNWTSSRDNQLFHVYKHYAELVPNSIREMTDCCGSSCYGPFVPQYLVAFTVQTNLSSTGGINQKQYSCWF